VHTVFCDVLPRQSPVLWLWVSGCFLLPADAGHGLDARLAEKQPRRAQIYRYIGIVLCVESTAQLVTTSPPTIFRNCIDTWDVFSVWVARGAKTPSSWDVCLNKQYKQHKFMPLYAVLSGCSTVTPCMCSKLLSKGGSPVPDCSCEPIHAIQADHTGPPIALMSSNASAGQHKECNLAKVSLTNDRCSDGIPTQAKSCKARPHASHTTKPRRWSLQPAGRSVFCLHIHLKIHKAAQAALHARHHDKPSNDHKPSSENRTHKPTCRTIPILPFNTLQDIPCRLWLADQRPCMQCKSYYATPHPICLHCVPTTTHIRSCLQSCPGLLAAVRLHRRHHTQPLTAPNIGDTTKPPNSAYSNRDSKLSTLPCC
jgi:hypothetical protein